jgi:hypothetical protein
MKLEDFKMYDVKVTGEVVMDPANPKLPLKDANGNIQTKWMRDSNPSAELKAKGLGSGRFFQTEMVETNTIAVTMALPGGVTATIGPLVSAGITVNLFEAQQREPFNAVALKIIAKEFQVVKEAAVNGDVITRPVAKITGFIMPGKQVEYDAGFEYYQHRRNSITHVDEPVLVWGYDDKGKLVQQKVIRHTGQIFLFGNQLEAEAAHIQTAINSHIPFKVKAEGIRPEAEGANKVDISKSDTVPTV